MRALPLPREALPCEKLARDLELSIFQLIRHIDYQLSTCLSSASCGAPGEKEF